MPPALVTIRVVPASADEDRVVHHRLADADVIVLADGAGGISGGREAAERIVGSTFGPLLEPADCMRALRALDLDLYERAACGEATTVLLVIRENAVFGASVGDSCVWALTPAGVLDLTSHQRRKPLIGSGAAEPVAFGPWPFVERVLVASDGLSKYAPRDRIRAATLEAAPDAAAAADALVGAARLPGGGLQDDLALVIIDPPRS